MSNEGEIGGCGCGGSHVKGRRCRADLKRDMVERLLAAWEKYPTERLGQFLVNAYERGEARDPFYVEDDALLELIEHRARLRR